jgi:hypothetical protein
MRLFCKWFVKRFLQGIACLKYPPKYNVISIQKEHL